MDLKSVTFTARTKPAVVSLLVGLLLSTFVCVPTAPAFSQSDNASDTVASDTDVAIRVGDMTVTRKKFESSVEGVLNKWLRKFRQSGRSDSPGLDVVRDRIREKLKKRFINKLVRRYSLKHSSVDVPDTAVDAYWNRAVKRVGSETDLRQRLKGQGLTEENFRNQARKRIKKKRFFEKNLPDLSVSDTEIESFYEENKEKFDGKALSEVQPKIRNNLMKQKRKQALEKLFEKMKKAVEIEVYISEDG